MLPLGVSAVTLGFGFLITLDQPPLDLRDSPLLVPSPRPWWRCRSSSAPWCRCSPGIDDRLRQAAATARRPAAARLADRGPAGDRPAAARRGRLRVRRLAGRVRRDVVPRPRRAPDAAGRDLRAHRPPWPDELRHGPGRLRRARRDDRRRDAAGRAPARARSGPPDAGAAGRRRSPTTAYRPCVDVDLRCPTGRCWPCSGRPAAASPRCCGRSPASSRSPRAAVRWDGADLAGVPTHKRGFALMFQDGQLFAHLTVARNVGYALRLRRAARHGAPGRRAARPGRPGGVRRPAARPPSPAASASGSRWPGRWPPSRGCCCSTSRSPRSTPACASGSPTDLRDILRAAGTTALMVTHDHEEAFTVADRMAVMRAGRVVQEGPIAEVWRAPADPETALFLGYARVFRDDAAAAVLAAAGRPPAPAVAVRRSALAAGPRRRGLRAASWSVVAGDPGADPAGRRRRPASGRPTPSRRSARTRRSGRSVRLAVDPGRLAIWSTASAHALLD